MLRQGRRSTSSYVAQEDELEEGTELVDEEVKAKIQREKNKEVQRPQGMIRRRSIAYLRPLPPPPLSRGGVVFLNFECFICLLLNW